MEKNTVSNFLWIIVTAIIMFALIAIASPFGVYIKNNLETFAGDYVEENDYSDEDLETDIITIDISYYKIDGDNSELFSKTQKQLKKFEKYYIPSPEIPGYVANTPILEGVAMKDLNLVVQYTAEAYQINYILNDGRWLVPETDIPMMYFYGDSITLPTSTHIQRQHYEFDGWYEDSEFKGKVIKSIDDCEKPYGKKIFYAKWKGSEFNITYYLNDKPNEYNGKNGVYYFSAEAQDSIATWNEAVLKSNGNLKDEYTKYSYGTEMELPTSLHKHGYTFLGWSTIPNDPDFTELDSNGKPKETKRTQITASDYGDLVLYAQWKRNEYKITYHTDFVSPAGGNGMFNIDNSQKYTIYHSYNNTPTIVTGYPLTYAYGDTFDLPNADTLSAQGYRASVWYNAPTKLSIGNMNNGYPLTYTPNDVVNKTKVSPPTAGFRDSVANKKFDHTDLHLYVKAVPNEYTVTFIRNCPSDATNFIGDGLTQNPVQEFRYDKTQKLNANPFVVYGYKFNGWNTMPQGNGIHYADETEIFNLTSEHNGNIRLYAQWQKVKVPVKVNIFYQNADKSYRTTPNETENLSIMTNDKFDVFTYVEKYKKSGQIFSHGFSYNASDINTHLTSFDSKTSSPFNITVTPDKPNGTLTVNIYYKLNTYKLTLVTNAPSKVKSASATLPGGSPQSFLAKSISIQVPYQTQVSLKQEHNSTYAIKNWTIVNSNGTTTETSEALDFTMPACDTTITLYSENDTFSIVFHRNFTAHEKRSKTFTMTDKNGKKHDYASCLSDCGNEKSGSVLKQYTCSHGKVSGYKFNEKIGTLPTITVKFAVDSKRHYVCTNWQYTPTGNTEISADTKIDATFLNKDNVEYDSKNKVLHIYAEWTKSSKTADHTFEKTVVAPTCTKAGSSTQKCKYCGYTLPSETIKALGHIKGPGVLKQKATCFRGPLYYYYCKRDGCGVYLSRWRNNAASAKTAHNSNPQGQCGSTHNVTWDDVCTGASYVHYWGTCREILCHNAAFSDGKYVDGCGVANSKKLWCGTHGRGTRRTWSCGLPDRVENGARVNGEKVRPNGKNYLGSKGW